MGFTINLNKVNRVLSSVIEVRILRIQTFTIILVMNINLEAVALLFGINYTQRVEILSRWLYVKDVARLDSALCCKAVRQIFLKQLAQDHIVLSARRHSNTSYMLDWLFLRSARIDTLVLLSFDDKVQSYVSQFGQYLKCVQLFISKETERDIAIITISKHCSQVYHFETVPTNHLTLLFGCCRALRHLSYVNLTGSEILIISTFCPQLHTLVLTVADSTGWENQLRCLSNCRDLRTLYISNADLSGCREDIIQIANNCPHLQIVSLGMMDCSVLAAMVHSCPHMACFRATLTDILTAELLRDIGQNWYNIQVLRLENQLTLPSGTVWDDACVGLVQQCVSLTELTVYNSKQYYETEKLYHYIGKVANRVHTPRGLLTSALIELVVTTLSGAALGRILQECVKLRNVTLLGASSSAAALQCLGAASVVDLSFSALNLTAEDLLPIHDLKILSIDDIPPGWGEQLVATVERCPALTELSLTFNHAVDTTFLPRLLQACPKLEELTLLAHIPENSKLCERGLDLLMALVQALCPHAWYTIIDF